MTITRSKRALAAVGALALCALSLMIADPPQAQSALTGGIVFIKDNNVWLTSPDGTTQVQVTTNGTAAAPYTGVTQDDSGTIVGVKGNQFIRMNRDGEQLNPPFGADGTDSPQPNPTPVDPALSPDGTKVAYWYPSGCEVNGTGVNCNRTRITNSTAFTSYGIHGESTFHQHPSWIGNVRYMMNRDSEVSYDDVGGGNDSHRRWFSDTDFGGGGQDLRPLVDGEVNAQVSLMAMVWGHQAEQLRIFTTPGSPPGPPTAPIPVCVLNAQTGPFRDVTWSPDGQSIAYVDDQGIKVIGNIDVNNCGASGPITLVIPGGSEPDWGPLGIGSSAGDETPPLVSGVKDTPDPFGKGKNKSTEITFNVNEDSLVIVTIRKNNTQVRELFNQEILAGKRIVRWDGKNGQRKLVANGTYDYRIVAEDEAGNVSKPKGGKVTVKR